MNEKEQTTFVKYYVLYEGNYLIFLPFFNVMQIVRETRQNNEKKDAKKNIVPAPFSFAICRNQSSKAVFITSIDE